MEMQPRIPVERALQEHMVALIRAFGLHHPEQTPCGHAVAVAEAHALMELTRESGLSQRALGERLQLQKGTVSRIVTLLTGRGWVERRRDAHDGRAVQLVVTAAGVVVAAQLAAAREAKFAGLLARLPVAERDTVLHALSVLVEALREP